MSSKRTADKELNPDNWDATDEPEESGRFRIATDRDLQKRVIRTAKRRATPGCSDEQRKGIFSSFGGFNKTSTPISSNSPFGFLSNMKNGKNELPISPGLNFLASVPKAIEKKEEADQKPSGNGSNILKDNLASNTKNSDEYCSNLRSLNLGVCEWIKSHIDKNPYCILTPIFDDYKRYLKDFDKFKTEPTGTDSVSPSKEISSKNEVKSQPFKIDDNIFSKSPPSGTSTLFPITSPKVETLSTPKSDENKLKENKLGTPNYTFDQGLSSTPISKVAPMFSFGQKFASEAPPTGNFSFGNAKPFSFGNAIKQDALKPPKQDEENEEDEEPPKASFTPVEEEGSIYSKRCKVFVKKDKTFGDRGVGTLYVKPINNSEKYQLIVRADTSLGNLLMNIVLSESVPTQRMGKNNVMLVCIPTTEAAPPPVPVLLRVKTSEEADALLETLNKYKK